MIDWLTDTLIATSALILLVLLVREPVRRQFGATVAYALWLIPAARLLMPPLTRTVERIVPAAPSGNGDITGFTLPAAAATTEPTLVEQLGGWPLILAACWLSVATVLLVRGLLVYRRQRAVVLGCGVQLARLDRIRIVRSEAVRGPMAFGILDPVIVLPVDFDERYDAPQRRLALDHELAHHRSGDLVANLIAYVLLCLQWFNPLAWIAHAAFRFDQEAACDARVLDMADGPDRAAYGRAIAKAASGRALLFAGALDRPKTLSRRLNSMLISSNPRRRLAGKALVLGAIAVALPLTATWATLYVDRIAPVPPVPTVPTGPVAALRAPLAPLAAPVPTAPVAPVAPLAALVDAIAAVAPAAPPSPPAPPSAPAPIASVHAVAHAAVAPQPDVSFIGRDDVRINGKTKKWSELTREERAHIRNETNRARIQLARERANIPQRLEEARREMEKFNNGDFERDMAQARREVAEALREIDRNKDKMRRAGVDAEKIKAQVRASLREVHKIDVAKIRREAMASINPAQIEASLREAERSLAEVEANLDRIDDE
jgi:bla regulator protein BlaR1